jgi:hypothetical protein
MGRERGKICVCERERERESGREREEMCVCEREREREYEVVYHEKKVTLKRFTSSKIRFGKLFRETGKKEEQLRFSPRSFIFLWAYTHETF